MTQHAVEELPEDDALADLVAEDDLTSDPTATETSIEFISDSNYNRDNDSRDGNEPWEVKP